MNIGFHTGLVIAAAVAAAILVAAPGNRLVPAIALALAALAVLIDFRVIQLSSTKFRIDVILPAALAVTGVISWPRAGTKAAVTSATVVTLVGVILALTALRVLR